MACGIKIDNEFSKILPQTKLTKKELSAYKERLISEPMFAKITVWKEQNLLLDGHLKLSLCKKYKIPYSISLISLPDRKTAKQWIVQNQLQQRNLSKWERIRLVINYWEADFSELAKANLRLSQGRGKQKKTVKAIACDVLQMLADKAGVCRETMMKVRHILRHATKEETALLDRQESSIERMYLCIKDRRSDQIKADKQFERHDFKTDLSQGIFNSIICDDVLKGITKIPNGSLDLMFTSPPFNCNKPYIDVDDNKPWDEYMDWLKTIFKTLKPKFRNGGRCVIEIEEIRTREEKDATYQLNRPTEAIIKLMMNELGYLYHSTIIWDKVRPVPCKPYGSYRSPSSPVIQPLHSFILVFCIGDYRLTSLPNESSEMTKDEWDELTQSVWRVERETHPYGGHCCAMPVKLAENVIKLFSHKGGLVGDIFGGSGTTAIAAIRNKRDYVLIEKSKTYCFNSKKRIDEEMARSSKIKLSRYSAA